MHRLEFSNVPGVANTDILTLNAQSVSLPSYTFAPIIIPHLNTDIKFAGRPSLGNMNVLFLNAYNLDAIRIIEAWHYKIYQPDTEQAGFAAQYKANAHLVVYLPDFSEFKHYDVLGIWPEDVGTKDYDWAVSDHVTRQVSFSVDKEIGRASCRERVCQYV